MKSTGIALAIAAVFALAQFAGAGNQDGGYRQGRNAGCQEIGKGKGHGGHGNGLMKMLQQLNLSDEQKQKVTEILAKSREQFQTFADQARAAHQAVQEQVHATTFNEQALRQACRQRAAAAEELAVLRAKSLSEIMPILTEEQRKALTDMRGKFRQRLFGHDDENTNAGGEQAGGNMRL